MLKKHHSRFLTIVFAFVILFSSSTCFSSWNFSHYNDEIKEVCNPVKLVPQMIKIPIVKHGWQVVERCDLVAPKDVAFSLIIFENAWEQTFGRSKPLIVSLNNIMIEWTSETKKITGYHVNGTKYVNAPIIGLTRTSNWIWVRIKPGQKICETSLVHELVHVAIWSEKGTDGDADHEGHRYSGWTPEHTRFIKRVNATLCATGL